MHITFFPFKQKLLRATIFTLLKRAYLAMFQWFNRLILFICTLLITCCVTQPGYQHVPHYLDHIPERASALAAQTRYLTPSLASLALTAYNKAQAAGYGGGKHILTIIDYSEPSTRNRIWVIDLDSNKVLFRELVAHGIGSGMLYATQFSDQVNSKTSSIGMYQTANNDYRGRHGHALRLQGLEPGFNGHALHRAIVVHAAPYVCDSYIKKYGYTGCTWGCPALNPKDINQIIATIKGGTLLFAYANDPNWLAHSRFLH